MSVITEVKALQAGPIELLKAEQEVLELEDRRRELLLQLMLLEADLLTRAEGPINGKNAEIRAAQLLQETAPEKVQINEFEREIARKKAHLEFLRNQFRVQQSIVALLAARPDLKQI